MRFLWTQENESIYIRREKRARVMIVASAAALTVLVFLLFMLLFTKKYVIENGAAFNSRKVIFLNPRRFSPEARRQFRRWLEYRNPALISKPNKKYGYNAILSRSSAAKHGVADLPLADALNEHSQITEISESLPPVMAEDHAHAGIYKFDFQRFKVRTLPQNNYKYPLLSDLRGNVYKDIISTPDAKGQLPRRPTLINVMNSPGPLPPKFQVAESCGDRNLDLRALRELMLNFDSLNIKGRNFVLLRVYWRKI